VATSLAGLDCLDAAQRKQAYYYLLLQFLPAILAVVRELRKRFKFGLVIYADQSLGPVEGNIISALEGCFKTEISLANKSGDFLRASYLVHNAIAVSMEIATEVWAARQNWEDPNLSMLLCLVDKNRQELYAGKAAQKRIASAMLQTLHISSSLERFGYGLFEETYKKKPTPRQVVKLHRNAMKTAVSLTEFHLERTRQIRPVLGASAEDGIVHRYVDCRHFRLIGMRIELAPDSLSSEMVNLPIDAQDGRIGCPGKKHIPEIWKWIESVSAKYSYKLARGIAC
jgi:hypothetical protein